MNTIHILYSTGSFIRPIQTFMIYGPKSTSTTDALHTSTIGLYLESLPTLLVATQEPSPWQQTPLDQSRDHSLRKQARTDSLHYTLGTHTWTAHTYLHIHIRTHTPESSLTAQGCQCSLYIVCPAHFPSLFSNAPYTFILNFQLPLPR